MKIIPFILKNHPGSLEMSALKLFVAHAGKAIWTTDETLTVSQLEQEYLVPNGLISKRVHLVGTTFFVEIDPEKTKCSDFYTWDEALQLPNRPECWRSYYFFKDTTGAEWFSSRFLQGDNELEGRPIHDYYEEILTCIK